MSSNHNLYLSPRKTPYGRPMSAQVQTGAAVFVRVHPSANPLFDAQNSPLHPRLTPNSKNLYCFGGSPAAEGRNNRGLPGSSRLVFDETARPTAGRGGSALVQRRLEAMHKSSSQASSSMEED